MRACTLTRLWGGRIFTSQVPSLGACGVPPFLSLLSCGHGFDSGFDSVKSGKSKTGYPKSQSIPTRGWIGRERI